MSLSEQELYTRLWLAFYDEAPSLATVYNWFNEFKRGRINLTNDLREGHPSAATTEDNTSAVRLMIETDNKVTDHQVWTSLGIGISQEHKIVHEHSVVRKLCVHWCRKMMQRFAGGDSNAVHDIVYRLSDCIGGSLGALWRPRRGLDPNGAPTGLPTSCLTGRLT
ncbi:Putative uncharacterized protein FLJ37770 [Eumeta japonica]|uniref:Mos1 transposase HTH domain-containing protein n=1 Tax=Eumeta variegata TaxID=151549 RepID=A0A4C1TMJ6_EUMVA|nr:Putative uncharacterized protein FLJ37770 [Eumeta japonica]